jgi:type IV pilus assembly protein PilF
MRSLPVLLVCGLLAACAHPSGTLSGRPGATPVVDERARIHTELASLYYARQQYAVALQEVSEALSADAGYAPAYDARGLIHAALHQDAKAEEDFKRAIGIDGQYSEARNNYGLFLCERGRYEEGLTQFKAALSDPLYATPDKALANAGVCSMARGDLVQAEDFLQRALRRAPNQLAALDAMANLRYRQGRTLAVRELLKRMATVSQLNAQALWLGVRTEHSLGDQVAEASYAAQLNRRFPGSQEAQWLLTGQYDQPRAHR